MEVERSKVLLLNVKFLFVNYHVGFSDVLKNNRNMLILCIFLLLLLLLPCICTCFDILAIIGVLNSPLRVECQLHGMYIFPLLNVTNVHVESLCLG